MAEEISPPSPEDENHISVMDLEENHIKVLGFFLADHVATENGKLYVNGGCISTIWAPSFPTTHPSLGAAAILRIPWREYQRDHRFDIALVSPQDEKLDFEVRGEFRVGAAANMRFGDPTIMPIAVNANGVRLDAPGHYTVVLSVDGRPLASWPLRATQFFGMPGIPMPPSGPPAMPQPPSS